MKNVKNILPFILIVCAMTMQAQGLTLSGLNPDKFKETIDGKQTELYVLKNSNGMEACITNYGARVVSLMAPNWNGRYEDVVLGYDNITDYHTKGQNFGATIGRYAGRIIGPKFSINGTEYKLQDDGGKGHISHGGKPGFQNRVWNVVSSETHKITLQYESPDGENGFPGKLTVTLTYTLTDQNALDVDFTAITTKPTVLNLTNHSFFNISGDLSRAITSQNLWIDSNKFAEYDKNKNVTGELVSVRNTPFDFTKPHQIGTRIDQEDAQLAVTGGYDHSFLLRHPGEMRKPAAIVYDAQSGRTLTVYTTEPAIHIYTGNGLKGNQVGKGGVTYPKRSAICLETMHFADSPNKPWFPSTLLNPGDTYHSKTVFMFSTDPPMIMKAQSAQKKQK